MSADALNVAYSLMTLEPGRPGGSETYARGVLAEFARGMPGMSTTVLATPRVQRAYADLDTPHIDFASVPGYPGAQTSARRLASMAMSPFLALSARRVLCGRVDVVHYPLTVPVPRLQAPRVVTLFDLNHHDLPHLWSRAVREYRRLAYDTAARHASLVITTSTFSQSRIVELLGIPAERIRVIPLGIDHGRFRPEMDENDERLPTLPDRFILYPAALHPHKNHGRLLKGLARTADHELELVLTGQTHGAMLRFEAEVRRLGLSGRVKHLGFLDGDLLPALYRRATALVFPSLHEGFGAPPLEAMACGCVVASSFEASLREICSGAAQPLNPLDVDSIAAAIDAVTCNAELRARLVAAGLERSRPFTWARAAEMHLDAYRMTRNFSPGSGCVSG